jgi:serine/threonine-protein kinase PknG
VKCNRPACAGTILDGYCDTCGMAPAKAAARPQPAPAQQAPPAAAAASPAPSAGSARSARSARLDVSRLTRGSRSSASNRRVSRVGAGVIEIPARTSVDPAGVVMAEPVVPEARRFCGRCDAPVGRAKGGRAGRAEGFCPRCGNRFDFTAKLARGDLVAGQYEVAGALAHGGLGWIYLARDRNVSMRWCVLKGLLDERSADAAEAAVAERRFLAEVAHPAIVEIYNFVRHEGQGYIVMEYVGGPSLKQLVKGRRQAGEGPMPPAEAAAYLLNMLPALGHLHEQGLVYCDFKPDNVIHVGDSVKLIDLGAVRRLDDPNAAIFGTVGFQAPEVALTGPTVASDLYTVGRTLAVLVLDWPDWQGADAERLPDRSAHAVLADSEALSRFLDRACHKDPEQRFVDAADMADQLHGVLCHLAAEADGQPRPRTSTRFFPPRPVLSLAGDWRPLPMPIVPLDPARPSVLAALGDGDVDAVLSYAATSEIRGADRVRVVRALCERNRYADARHEAAALATDDVSDCDVRTASAYLLGVVELAAGNHGVSVRGGRAGRGPDRRGGGPSVRAGGHDRSRLGAGRCRPGADARRRRSGP